MTIRTRLTMLFTGLMALVLGLILASVYALSVANTRSEFFGRLRERTIIAANVFLETDELARHTLMEFNSRYLVSLPEEVVFLIDSAGTHRFVETTNAPVQPSAALIDAVRHQRNVQEYDNGTQRYGTYYHDNQGSFVIIAQARDVYGQSKLDNLRLVLMGAFGVGVMLAFLAGMFFARRALMPMNAVIRRVDSISASNLDARVDGGDSQDEIGNLVRTFNGVLDRLEDAFRRQQEFVANASHELRTPLTTIIGRLEVQLARARSTEESRDSNVALLAEARRLSTIVDALLLIAQAHNGDVSMEAEQIRLDELVLDAVSAARQRCASDRIVPRLTVESDSVDLVTFIGYPTLLRMALDNIIDNALKYSSGTIRVELHAQLEECTITVHDDGIGISPEEIEKIGRLFYRASNVRSVSGYGVGLALTRELMSIHKADLRIDSVEGRGTKVTMTFWIRNATH